MGEGEIEEFYLGEITREGATLSSLAADEDMVRTVEAWVAKGKLGKLLELWVKGLSFDWRSLYGETKPRRISVPTYPFARERYWFETAKQERPAQRAGGDGDAAAAVTPAVPGVW